MISEADDAADPLSVVRHRSVSQPVTCVLTRFVVRRAWQLLASYRDYRRLVCEIEGIQPVGLLHSAFLVENPTTWHSLSLWSRPEAIPHFGSDVLQHVDVARRVFRRLRLDDELQPELWSTTWRLESVSNNLNWRGFDLRSQLR